jgi:hypothetical protein
MSIPTETTVLLTPRQVAERVKLSLSTLSKMRLATAGAGAIPYLKLGPKGGAVRYDADAVQSWLDAQPRRRSTSDISAA